MSTLKSDKSLSDVHESVQISHSTNRWKRLIFFLGPAYLISVGYMDPGNWATDLAGGSQFGYKLIWVLLMSNLMALVLQSLSARLGIVRGRDLAQCNREAYPRYLNFILYILAELAIIACDLAEILGMAIGLQLLLDIPLIIGVIITVLDTFILMYLQRLGIRKMEAFIITLIAIIGGCFLVEMFLAKPDMSALAKGFIPTIPNSTALYIAIGIIGATVMPHNLYLHSALVQTRKIKRDKTSIRKAIKMNIFDSAIALNLAFFVNAAILVLAASTFFGMGSHVDSLGEAHKLLTPLLGNKWASHLFAIALIVAGQSSTITGTLAGQIVMEGYLKFRINPLARRLITRLLAIIPAVAVILIVGESDIDNLLVLSQVVLSIQLAFAIIPLIHFVSDKNSMGTFAIGNKTKICSWLITSIIIFLNLQLVYQFTSEWMKETESIFAEIFILLIEITLPTLILITFLYPLLKNRNKRSLHVHNPIDIKSLEEEKPTSFYRIALALDYSSNDSKVVKHALSLGNSKTEYILIHVVESATVRFIGKDSDDYETREDLQLLKKYRDFFESKGHEVEMSLGYRNRVKEISRLVKKHKADLLVVGSHGHFGLKDVILGETINRLRHITDIPIFIAK